MKFKVFICHYCCSYITDNKKDMKKHFKRKNQCKCMTLHTYENAEILSTTKLFIFEFDYTQLLEDDFIYIINNFYNTENIISINFKINNYINNIDNIDNIDNNYNDNSLIILDKEELKEDNKYEKKKEFDKIYFNKELNKYICPYCESKYTTKYNFVNHMNNEEACKKQQKINEMIKKTEKNILIRKEKELNEKKEINKHILQNSGNLNINTQNNNINNINNNNNTQNNTYNLAMNDFVNERYDLTHIKDSFYSQKDFFIYPNFLNMIMENKKNQNLFFTNGEAIVYSDNEIIKMSSDKAGYLILDKLSQSFEEFLSKQDAPTKEYYKFINKYYYVIKGHYKHDTILKDYDVDARQFYYTSQGNLFRSRDKYLSKMTTTVNKFSNNVRENMNLSGHDLKNIPLINPNIEDFASVRMRYRDLKDKD